MGIHDGHRERLKERFYREGLESFEPHNALELILCFAIPRIDTNVIAHRLMNEFKTFSGVLDASIEELCKVEGVGRNAATLIKLFLPVARYYDRSRLDNEQIFQCPEQCGDYLLSVFAGMRDEKVVLMCMDNRCRLLDCPVVSEGDISHVGVSSRKIIEEVIRTGATCVIMSHNHPGGVALPSDDDVASTIQIEDTLRHIGVKLMDHIIVADGDYVSFLRSEKYRSIFK